MNRGAILEKIVPDDRALFHPLTIDFDNSSPLRSYMKYEGSLDLQEG